MKDQIKVEFHNEKTTKTYNEGVTFLEISKDVADQYEGDIVIAAVNNSLIELKTKLHNDAVIKFYDQYSLVGSRVFIRGLILLFIKAFHDIIGNDTRVRIENSLDKGIYAESTKNITEEEVLKITKRMQDIVRKGKSINAVDVHKSDALAYFKKIGETDKEDVYNYVTSSTVRLYEIENRYDYFYGEMPPDVSIYRDFGLTYLNPNGIVLRFPTVYQKSVPEYIHHPQMFKVFKENADWVKNMNLGNAADINNIVSKGKSTELIYMAETIQTRRISEIVDMIFERRDQVKIVLIAGPSSSGKTTTSKKIALQLKILGLNPKNLSTDDYFVERGNTPLDEYGDPDYETVEAIDIDLFNDQLNKMIDGESVITPTYNFLTGKKEYHEKNKLILEENDVLIIEGIHGLNELLTKAVPKDKKFKIYISPLTQINVDNHNKVNTTDTRLMRRMIRDYNYRGYDPIATLKAWPSVRRGEEKYIFPYQDSADVILNSALIYEIGVLKSYVLPLLYSVRADDEEYIEAKRLICFLRNFLPISSEYVPKDSHLREFIGGSSYRDI